MKDSRGGVIAVPVCTDNEQAAFSIGLRYVNERIPGIARKRSGKGWKYFYIESGKPCDDNTILRIKKLVIPPAWENVWICPFANGHLQVTGLDAKNRKQYKYHEQWTSVRNESKFNNLYNFGIALPKIRSAVEHDLLLNGMPEKKVIAVVIKLMDVTAVRIGSAAYEKLYGSHGLTTLHDKHVKISGNKLKIEFRGKKGIEHSVEVTNSRLQKLIKKCKEIPGQELFQYIDESGNRKPVESGMINNYLKEVSGTSFTAKDFRTWKGTAEAVRCLLEIGLFENESQKKKNVITAFDVVSKSLGNTRTVCKKYYVHPTIIKTYENGDLNDKLKTSPDKYFASEELITMKLLKKDII